VLQSLLETYGIFSEHYPCLNLFNVKEAMIMLSKKMEKALNKQIQEELYSGYLYLAMSAYFADQNLNGFATWMRMQAKEEDSHAMKFYSYIVEHSGQPVVPELKQPPKDFKGPADIFKKALEHERHITACIAALVDLAIKEKDKATESFLQWYVDEQVEEENHVDGVIKQLNIVKDDGPGLWMLDQEMGLRTFVPLPGIENRMA
jgi:ferritin